MLKFKVHSNINEKIAHALAQASAKAEATVAEQVLKDTTPFVPASGAAAGLFKRSYSDGGTVVYPGPYARYLYYGKLMVDPNTGSSYAPKDGTKTLTDKNLVFTNTVHPQAQAHWFEASKAQNLEKWLRDADKAVKKDLGKK